MIKQRSCKKSRNTSANWRAASLFSLGLLALTSMTIDQRDASAGTGGTGGTGVTGGGAGGAPSATFSDTFENSLGWWFNTSDLGNGYISTRTEARSPSHVGDEYSNHNPTGQWQSLNKRFTFDINYIPTDCQASIWIRPLTVVTGALEVDDALTGNPIQYKAFALPATNTWTQVSTDLVAPSQAPTGKVIIVRVELLGNGAWQEFLIDDLFGWCPAMGL
jgi:hypothetical protein